jgi:hypothetical protein
MEIEGLSVATLNSTAYWILFLCSPDKARHFEGRHLHFRDPKYESGRTCLLFELHAYKT